MPEEILDLTRVARRLKSRCQHNWQPARGGLEKCALCRDTFPCRDQCTHLDCIFRRAELLHEGRPVIAGETIPTDGSFPWTCTLEEQRGPMRVIVFDTAPEDPLDWVDPFVEAQR